MPNSLQMLLINFVFGRYFIKKKKNPLQIDIERMANIQISISLKKKCNNHHENKCSGGLRAPINCINIEFA